MGADAVSPGADEASTWELEELAAQLTSSLIRAEECLDAFDGADRSVVPGAPRGVGPVTGAEGEAQENRMIRLAGARLARSRSKALRQRVQQARARAAVIHERAERIEQGMAAASERGPGAVPRETSAQLVGSLSTGSMRAEDGVERVLRQTVEAALVSIPGARHVGISMHVPAGAGTGPTSTDVLVARIDELQVEVDEGPCLEAIRTDRVVIVDDLHRERGRWPAFVPRALDLGLRSTLSLPLLTHRGRPGIALNVHAEQAGGISEADVAAGRALVALAERTLDGAFAVDGLHVALRSRDVIGQAKGMLMLRHGFDADRAFSWLREASQAANIKLVDVARWYISDS